MRAPARLGLALLLLLAEPAGALDPAALDLQLRVRAAPEGGWANRDSPFSPVAGLAGVGEVRGQGEAELRLRLEGLTADVAGRLTALEGSRPSTDGVLNELFHDLELLGSHLTLGKKVLSWDVGHGFRPLDVIQQEDRRAFQRFALEGVPLLALEHFRERSATALVYANPLRGRSPRSRDDEALALRHYQRLGGLDLHLVGRWSQRSLGQGGLAGVWVPADVLELHASVLYQRRVERAGDARLDPGASPLSATDPARVRRSEDAVAALVGFTLTPGWELSFLVEGWIDPEAATASEWRARADLARLQGDLLAGSTAPRPAVLANLAWGLRAFEGRSLVRENLLLHASQRWDRFEPTLDVLWTPADGGLVATASVAWEGERARLAVAVRAYGGARHAAVRLLPQGGTASASWELRW
jgi:hypothetical protein